MAEQGAPGFHGCRVHVEHALHLEAGGDGLPGVGLVDVITEQGVETAGWLWRRRHPRPWLVGAVRQRRRARHEVREGFLQGLGAGGSERGQFRRDGGEKPVVEQQVVRAVGIVVLEIDSGLAMPPAFTTLSVGRSGEASLLAMTLSWNGGTPFCERMSQFCNSASDTSGWRGNIAQNHAGESIGGGETGNDKAPVVRVLALGSLSSLAVCLKKLKSLARWPGVGPP